MSDNMICSVVFKFDRGRAAIFEGTEEQVYHWLAKVDQHSIWEIFDRTVNTYESVPEFLHRVGDQYKPKPPLTEEDVRKIVDRRIREVLERVGKEAEDRAHGLAAYEVGELARPAFDAVAKLMENITERLGE